MRSQRARFPLTLPKQHQNRGSPFGLSGGGGGGPHGHTTPLSSFPSHLGPLLLLLRLKMGGGGERRKRRGGGGEAWAVFLERRRSGCVTSL